MENQTSLVVVLPPEVNELAVKVSEQKQAEVLSVLNQIFTGTSDWEKQVDAIEVKGIEDKMSIQLADVARKNVKIARLNAEKIFDAKRDEVQQIKAEYDLEDKLWLKAKQVMQIKFKAIEDKAEYKSQFVQRYMAEQRELRTQLRIEQVSKFNPELNRIEFENMNDEMFSIFLSGIKKAQEDRIAEERWIEAERIAAEKAAEEERLRMIAENARLQREAEVKEKRDQKRNDELRGYIIFIRDYVKMLNMDEPEYQKELVNIKIAAKQHYKYEAKKELELANERAAARKLADELQAKKDADLKAQKDAEAKAAADLKAKQEADRKAAAAPDKDKLLSVIASLTMPEMSLKTAWGQNTEQVIREKFEGFREWAKKTIEAKENSLGIGNH